MIGQAALTTHTPQFIPANYTGAQPPANLHSELRFLPVNDDGRSRLAREYRPMRPWHHWGVPQGPLTYATRDSPQENVTPGERRKMTQAGEEGYGTQTSQEPGTTRAGEARAVTQASEERNLTQADEATPVNACDAQAGLPTVIFLTALGVASPFALFLLVLFLAKRRRAHSEQKADAETQRNARPLLNPQYV